MTDEQIIEALECCITQDGTIPCYSCPCWDYDNGKCKGLSYSDILSLIARQKAEIEKLKAFKSYFDELYGKGLDIANWHLNGALEPFDTFYESAL